MLKITDLKKGSPYFLEMPPKSWEEYKKRVYKIIPTSLHVLKISEQCFPKFLDYKHQLGFLTSDTNAEVTPRKFLTSRSGWGRRTQTMGIFHR